MKVLFLDFLHDNIDEAGIVTLAYTVSYVDLISRFLSINGWTANHFLLGTLGQFIYILFDYLSGKKRKKEGLHSIAKKLTSLFLGGTVAMMLLPALPFVGALMSVIGVGIGFAFQKVWLGFLDKYIDKIFPSEDDGGKE